MPFLQDREITVTEVMGTRMELVACDPEANPNGLDVHFARPGDLGIHKRAHMAPGALLVYMPPEIAQRFLSMAAVKAVEATKADT